MDVFLSVFINIIYNYIEKIQKIELLYSKSKLVI